MESETRNAVYSFSFFYLIFMSSELFGASVAPVFDRCASFECIFTGPTWEWGNCLKKEKKKKGYSK